MPGASSYSQTRSHRTWMIKRPGKNTEKRYWRKKNSPWNFIIESIAFKTGLLHARSKAPMSIADGLTMDTLEARLKHQIWTAVCYSRKKIIIIVQIRLEFFRRHFATTSCLEQITHRTPCTLAIMHNYQKTYLLCLECGVLKFGEFLLKSGPPAPIFLTPAYSTPEQG